MEWAENHFSLENFMAMQTIGDAALLCGYCRLQQPVTRINVVEDLPLLMWCSEGDIVLNSGYSFSKNPQLLLQTILQIQQAGVVALGLKPDRRTNTIPQEAQILAEELGFPLILLPPTAVFASIVYEGREAILRSREESLLHVQRQTQNLLEQLLRCNTPMEYLQVTERAIGMNPVVACGNDNEILITPAAREVLDLTVQDELISILRSNPHKGSVSIEVESLPRPVKVNFFHFEMRKGCSMLVLEYHRPLHGGELEMLRRISPVLSLEIGNDMAIKKVRRRHKDRFVKSLIAGKLGTLSDICTVAETQGYLISPESRYRVAVTAPEDGRRNTFSEDDIGVINHLTHALKSMVAFTLHDGYLVLIFEDRADVSASVLLSDLQQRISRVLHRDNLSFCISDAYGIAEMPEAYAEANCIRRISSCCGIRDNFITYEHLGVMALLAQLPKTKAVQRYQNNLLQPIKQYDAQHNSHLQRTLEVYLSTGCNAKRTAQLLFTHYNTVSYRIERIKQIGRYRLDDPEEILRLQIALKMELLKPEGLI